MRTKRNVYVWAVRLLMRLAVGITSAITLFVVGFVLVKGIPHLSWQFLSTKPSYLSGNIGILPDILNTVYIVIDCLTASFSFLYYGALRGCPHSIGSISEASPFTIRTA